MKKSTPKDRVLDAYAILAFLQGEASARRVESLLKKADAGGLRLYVSMVNAGEVYYRLVKLGSEQIASDFVSDVGSGAFPLQIVSATDARVLAAARLKAAFPISFADAFAAALGVEKAVPVVTGDPEFAALAKAGTIIVDWL